MGQQWVARDGACSYMRCKHSVQKEWPHWRCESEAESMQIAHVWSLLFQQSLGYNDESTMAMEWPKAGMHASNGRRSATNTCSSNTNAVPVGFCAVHQPLRPQSVHLLRMNRCVTEYPTGHLLHSPFWVADAPENGRRTQGMNVVVHYIVHHDHLPLCVGIQGKSVATAHVQQSRNVWRIDHCVRKCRLKLRQATWVRQNQHGATVRGRQFLDHIQIPSVQYDGLSGWKIPADHRNLVRQSLLAHDKDPFFLCALQNNVFGERQRDFRPSQRVSVKLLTFSLINCTAF